MKKKSLLISMLAVVLVALVAVGGTLAYFTSQDDAANTFTMGNVAIDLQESNDGTSWVEDGLQYEGVVPGDTNTKIAKVTVADDSADAYIMMTVEVEADEAFTAEDVDALYEAIQAEIGDAWTVTTMDDGKLQCVYNEAVAAGEEVILFEEITVPVEFGNNTAGKSFGIVLNAYAIQADHVELESFDWASVDFETGHTIAD